MSDATIEGRFESGIETPATYVLVSLFVLVYVVHLLVEARYGDETLRYLFYVQSSDLERVWTWFTSPFGHVNEVHLAVNATFLLVFGGALERVYGGKLVVAVFLLVGVLTAVLGTLVADAVHCGLSAPSGPCVAAATGASMGLFGLVGFDTGARPTRDLYFYPTDFSVPLWVFSGLFVVISLLGMFTSVDPLAALFGFYPGHDHHLVGLAVGAALGLLWSRRA